MQDHLHIRGEHSQTTIFTKRGTGSSPHTWRTHYLWGYAERHGMDHLHIRGEHKETSETREKRAGSSPHTWRTRQSHLTIQKR